MKVEAVCISQHKGVVKTPVPVVDMIVEHGIRGDAHAGDWHRQVSLLACESIARVRNVLPDLKDGAFGENLITSGVDWRLEATVGDRVRIGDDVLLEITQIGKECHTACAIGKATGDCIMPREGVFCRVLAGGSAQAGAPLWHDRIADALSSAPESET